MRFDPGFFRESWHVGALGNVDAYRVLFACYQIVALQSPAELVGLNADNGIGGLVKVLFPSEHLSGHRVALYFLISSGKCFCNDKLQEFPLPVCGMELRAVKNPLHLPSDLFSGRRGILFGDGFHG